MKDKTILLGVTGSIAAYKAVEVASKLTQAGCQVDVVMTRCATEFVTPLSFRSITHRPVITDMFADPERHDIEHIALAERADAVLICPATANIIAKLAAGIADDMLTCVVLATKAPVMLAPAMNVHMWQNPITQENTDKLRARSYQIIEPGYGSLACGDVGQGRLAGLEDILTAVRLVLDRKDDFAGRQIVVTAGGTQEPIDPVRLICNRSSGKMGYALARAAADRGAGVTLISAPTSLPTPPGVDLVPVQTALQMREAVLGAAQQASVLIMAAAVADYRPATAARSKLKKEDFPLMQLELIRNPDIISEVPGTVIKVGFAAESDNLIQNATAKLQNKGVHLIVANNITEAGSGFGSDTNKITLIDARGNTEDLPLMTKTEAAHRILDKIASLMSTGKAGATPGSGPQ
jgi:phosphopantothenoylcysteine decarboxylase / phosphopantothenate---cysteine ligase